MKTKLIEMLNEVPLETFYYILKVSYPDIKHRHVNHYLEKHHIEWEVLDTQNLSYANYGNWMVRILRNKSTGNLAFTVDGTKFKDAGNWVANVANQLFKHTSIMEDVKIVIDHAQKKFGKISYGFGHSAGGLIMTQVIKEKRFTHIFGMTYNSQRPQSYDHVINLNSKNDILSGGILSSRFRCNRVPKAHDHGLKGLKGSRKLDYMHFIKEYRDKVTKVIDGRTVKVIKPTDKEIAASKAKEKRMHSELMKEFKDLRREVQSLSTKVEEVFLDKFEQLFKNSELTIEDCESDLWEYLYKSEDVKSLKLMYNKTQHFFTDYKSSELTLEEPLEVNNAKNTLNLLEHLYNFAFDFCNHKHLLEHAQDKIKDFSKSTDPKDKIEALEALEKVEQIFSTVYPVNDTERELSPFANIPALQMISSGIQSIKNELHTIEERHRITELQKAEAQKEKETSPEAEPSKEVSLEPYLELEPIQLRPPEPKIADLLPAIHPKEQLALADEHYQQLQFAKNEEKLLLLFEEEQKVRSQLPVGPYQKEDQELVDDVMNVYHAAHQNAYRASYDQFRIRQGALELVHFATTCFNNRIAKVCNFVLEFMLDKTLMIHWQPYFIPTHFKDDLNAHLKCSVGVTDLLSLSGKVVLKLCSIPFLANRCAVISKGIEGVKVLSNAYGSINQISFFSNKIINSDMQPQEVFLGLPLTLINSIAIARAIQGFGAEERSGLTRQVTHLNRKAMCGALDSKTFQCGVVVASIVHSNIDIVSRFFEHVVGVGKTQENYRTVGLITFLGLSIIFGMKFHQSRSSLQVETDPDPVSASEVLKAAADEIVNLVIFELQNSPDFEIRKI